MLVTRSAPELAREESFTVSRRLVLGGITNEHTHAA
jgi:hypothetical protein